MVESRAKDAGKEMKEKGNSNKIWQNIRVTRL